MDTKRLLTDTVVLKNYIGEVDDVATYQEAKFVNCYCVVDEGADLNMQGHKANNRGQLYIFDEKTVALSVKGSIMTYKPYQEWLKLSDKRRFWTISDKGTDYFHKEGTSQTFRIIGFKHKQTGSKRMWHFEVDGR